MKTCEVEGCEGQHVAKGLCNKHYRRLLSGGDPHVTSRKERSLEERFRAKLAPPDPITGCIEWTASRNNKDTGYGQIRQGDKHSYVHRLAYELKHGPIPAGLFVCHRCDNPPCCNPDHLYLDTHAGNMADMVGKGRSAKGYKRPNPKLTEADVWEIRRRLAAGESQSSIAKVFGVALKTIGNIKTGKTWSRVA